MLCYCVILICLTCVACEYFRLSEGSDCSWDGISGRCVPVHQCLSAVLDIRNKNDPPICSFNGNTPVICCTDCNLVNDTSLLLFDPHFGILMKTGTNKAKDKCLEYIHKLDYSCKRSWLYRPFCKNLNEEGRCTGLEQHDPENPAVGCISARREEYPHMIFTVSDNLKPPCSFWCCLQALLGYGDNVDTADWLCGGSVISERFILTAAHCLSSPAAVPVRFRALGIQQRSDPASLWQKYSVLRIISHPGYQPPSKYNDIALLETDREISFNSVVRPACLHVDNYLDPVAFATGWGALGHRQDLADVLQTVGLTRISEEECSEYYPKHRHLVNGFDPTTQLCYGDDKISNIPTDTCEGDSGGPLQSTEHEQCVYTILGVTSFGRQCGERGGTGIYTRVAHYVPWIEDIVWPDVKPGQ